MNAISVLTNKRTRLKNRQQKFTYLLTPSVEKPSSGMAGLHCHTIIKTIQQTKSRIKEVKGDQHSNSLAKIQVCAIFRAGDIRRNVSTQIYKAMYGDAMFVSL